MLPVAVSTVWYGLRFGHDADSAAALFFLLVSAAASSSAASRSNCSTAAYLAVVSRLGKRSSLNSFGLMWCNGLVCVPILVRTHRHPAGALRLWLRMLPAR